MDLSFGINKWTPYSHLFTTAIYNFHVSPPLSILENITTNKLQKGYARSKIYVMQWENRFNSKSMYSSEEFQME